MASTINAATFMEKNFSTIESFVKNFFRSHVETDVRCHRAIDE